MIRSWFVSGNFLIIRDFVGRYTFIPINRKRVPADCSGIVSSGVRR